MRLDLACGKAKQRSDINGDWVGVDKIQFEGVDFVYDLEQFPWPWEDNSVDEIHCSHYIEHTKDIIKFMDEMWRILKPECKAIIIAPYYANMRAMQDPTHTRVISEATFLYFNKVWRDAQNFEYPIKSDFDFTYGYAIVPEWANRAEEARNFAIKHYMNVVSDIHVTLTKRLEQSPKS